MMKNQKKLGEMLMEAGLIDDLQLSSALGQQRQWGGRLASTLINMGIVDEHSIATVLEKKLGHKCILLKNMKVSPRALKTVKPDIVTKYRILPLDSDEKTLTIAMSDPDDLKTIDELSFALGLEIKAVFAIESSINDAIAQHYTGTTSGGKRHIPDTKRSPESVQITMNEIPRQNKTYPPDLLIEAISEILVEKGIIKKEDLGSKIAKKLKRSQF